MLPSSFMNLKRCTKLLLLLVLVGEVQVQQARICYGGVAPKCLMATNTQAALEGQPWTQGTLDAALLAVAKDVNITPDAPGQLTSCLAGCSCPLLHCLVASKPFLAWVVELSLG